MVLAEETWRTKGNHTVELLPTISRLMDRAGLATQDLGAIAVAQGPGSFTGVRIGMSLAKGLALSRGVPLLAIPTLDIIAYGQSARHLPVRAVIQAGRGRLCWADYRWHHRRWRQQGETTIGTAAELVSGVRERTLFCGEIYEEEMRSIESALGSGAVIASPAEGVRRASYLAELAYRRLRQGDADTEPVAPVYALPNGGVIG